MSNADICVHCGACTETCLFLEKYQIDLAGLARRPELAYSCFLCGKCAEVCPRSVNGAGIALRMRKEQTGRGAGARRESAYQGLLWEKNPYKFSNYRKAAKKTVLFPGCNFPSFYPKTTERLEEILAKHGIGVVYECCGKPVYELGLTGDAEKKLKQMEKRLEEQGVEELVMVCPNCCFFLEEKIHIPMVTVYEKLKELGEGKTITRDVFPVYVPCPDRASKKIFEQLRYYLDGEIRNAYEDVQCCGLGGCAAVKEPELSKEMARRAKDCGVLYTYCASCVSSFRRKGFEQSYHLLPLILGVDEKIPLGIWPLVNRMKKIL